MKGDKQNNEIYISNALKEVWEWKQKVYETTKDFSTEELLTHYKNSSERIAKLLNTKIVLNSNGGFRFE